MSRDFLAYFSQDVMNHQPFPGLLELPLRSDAVRTCFESELPSFRYVEATRKASKDDLYGVHNKEYIDLIFAMAEMGIVRSTLYSLFDPRLQYYCRVSQGTVDAITASCGLVLEAFDDIQAKRISKAFCIVRPPGHHAGIARGEGFCLVNNVAVVAKKALDSGMRVAVVDFDRHHGNGTQEIAETLGHKMLFVSSYQEGCKYAKGYSSGRLGNNTLLVSIPEYSSDDVLITMYAKEVVPALLSHSPDIVIISAGFDMCDGDPLTNLHITPTGYGEITRLLVEAADITAQGRVISVLEGGYNPTVFMPSLLTHVKTLGKA